MGDRRSRAQVVDRVASLAEELAELTRQLREEIVTEEGTDGRADDAAAEPQR